MAINQLECQIIQNIIFKIISKFAITFSACVHLSAVSVNSDFIIWCTMHISSQIKGDSQLTIIFLFSHSKNNFTILEIYNHLWAKLYFFLPFTFILKKSNWIFEFLAHPFLHGRGSTASGSPTTKKKFFRFQIKLSFFLEFSGELSWYIKKIVGKKRF